MKFWALEVKPGKPSKVEVPDSCTLRVTQVMSVSPVNGIRRELGNLRITYGHRFPAVCPMHSFWCSFRCFNLRRWHLKPVVEMHFSVCFICVNPTPRTTAFNPCAKFMFDPANVAVPGCNSNCSRLHVLVGAILLVQYCSGGSQTHHRFSDP
jgi:hypothetical protein